MRNLSQHIHMDPTSHRERAVRGLTTHDPWSVDASYESDIRDQCYELLHDLCVHPRTEN